MRVEELMSSPVIITHRENTIKNVKDLFNRRQIHAAPVLENDGTISGIISSSNLSRCNDDNARVEDYMSDRIHIVLPNNRVIDAANMMIKNQVHHLVVMTDGNVIGMISSLDIVRIYAIDNTPA